MFGVYSFRLQFSWRTFYMFGVYSFRLQFSWRTFFMFGLCSFQTTVQLADILHVWFVLISGYSSVGRHSTCLACTHFRLQFSWQTFYMFVLYSFQATVQLADILHVCLVLISDYSSVGRHSTCLSCTHFRLQFSWQTFYMFVLYSFQATVQLADILHVCLVLIMSPPCKGWETYCFSPCVCGSVCLSVTKSCPLYNLITVTDISTKQHTFVKHIETTCHAQEP